MRKKNGYSQEDLAQKLGISRQAISKWERAESSPDTDNLIALSKLYNVSIDALLESDEDSIENERYAKQIHKDDEVQANHVSIQEEKTNISRWYRFPFPLFPVIIYCLLGVLSNKWGVYWFVFLSIPIYYLTVTYFHLKEIHHRKN